MATKALAAAIALSVSTLANAQYVVTHRVDNINDKHKAEVALRVSQSTGDVVVSWMHFVTTGSTATVRVYYNVSTDGQSFGTPGLVPIPAGQNLRGGDPMIAFGQDGTSWIGYLNPHVFPNKFWIAMKEAGAAVAQTAFAEDNPDEVKDKGVLVTVPSDSSASDDLALVYARFPVPGQTTYRLRSRVSPLSIPTPPSFPVGNEHPDGNVGSPNSVIIVRNSPSLPAAVGQWTVAYQQTIGGGLNQPRATWSPNGVLWFSSVDPTLATVPCPAPCTLPQTEAIAWVSPGAPPLSAGAPAVGNLPSIAADPNDESTMYMVFLGRAASDQDTHNIDLFIARSIDAGRNFSGDPLLFEQPGERVLRLRDVEDLGDPPGAVQFLPTVAVDAYGGVNVFYSVAWLDAGVWKYRIKFLSIAQFSTRPHPSMWTLNITPVFDMTEQGVEYHLQGDRFFFGDYTWRMPAAARSGAAIPAGTRAVPCASTRRTSTSASMRMWTRTARSTGTT